MEENKEHTNHKRIYELKIQLSHELKWQEGVGNSRYKTQSELSESNYEEQDGDVLVEADEVWEVAGQTEMEGEVYDLWWYIKQENKFTTKDADNYN
jgi:hypothetical protein